MPQPLPRSSAAAGQGFPLLPASLFVLAGVMLALWMPGPPRPVYWVLAAALAIPALWLGRRGLLLALLLAGFALTGLQLWQALREQLPLALEGHSLILQGRVEGLPEPGPSASRFILVVDDLPQTPAALRGRRLQVGWYDTKPSKSPKSSKTPRTAAARWQRQDLHAGDRWRFTLGLKAPRGLVNPGGFDAERFALAAGISAKAVVQQPHSAQRLQASQGGMDAWREAMSARIAAALPAGGGRFMQALALGDTHALNDADWELLRKVGLTHLIAISGFHVGVVAAACGQLPRLLWWLWPMLGRYWPRRQACALAVMLGGIGYACVAGSSLPTLRTVLMIVVAVLHVWLRQRANVSRTLALVLLAMLLWNPLSVLQAGFWLSFGGVAWLVCCMPDGPQPMLRSFLTAQVVVSLGLVPLTVAWFGQVSLLGPLVNLLAIPWWSLGVVPVVLLGTGLEALLPGSGQWAWQLAEWAFRISWQLFQWVAQSPVATWVAPESAWLALPLALLGAFWMLLPRPAPGRWLAPLLWLPMCLPWQAPLRDGQLRMDVLDVGQGLAVLLRTREHTLLYDTGPKIGDGFDAGERVVVPALQALGVRRLDRLVLSHADADHAGGYPAVLAALPVADSQAPAGAPVTVQQRCAAGQHWQWDGVQFEFLFPVADIRYRGNASGCVLRIVTTAGAVLLPADIGQAEEAMLLRRQAHKLRAAVVLMPHHGSAGSSSPAFTRAVRPQLALVSTGYGNRYRHPRPQALQHWRQVGAEIHDTAQDGMLTVWLREGDPQLMMRRQSLARLWDAAERARVAAILSADEHAALAPED